MDQFFELVSHLPMVDFCYNLSNNEASAHFLFLVSYEYQSSALIDRLWLVIDAVDLVANSLFDFASVWNVFRELLTRSKHCMASRYFRLPLTFVHEDLYSFFQRFTYSHV